VLIRSNFNSETEEGCYDEAYVHYAKEMEAVNKINYLKEMEVENLIVQLDHWINYNKQIYDKLVLQDSSFSLRLLDVEQCPYVNVRWEVDRFILIRSNEAMQKRKVLISTYGRKLKKCLEKQWGGDVITSGYALLVEIYDELSLEKNLDIVCVRLITRYPLARKDLTKFPLRALHFYLASPKSTSLWLQQKLTLRPHVNKYPFNERDHWITYNKCELCKVCHMPEVDQKIFHPQLLPEKLNELFV
jgi:hypothetical protein